MFQNELSYDRIVELIQRRRRQLLVHSVIYYRLNDNVISDAAFDDWSKELAELQSKHPEIAKECEWHEGFKDFDGSTGAFLPIHDPQAVAMALRVLESARYKQRGL